MGSIHLSGWGEEATLLQATASGHHRLSDLRLFERDLVVDHACEISSAGVCTEQSCACVDLFLDFVMGQAPLGRFLYSLRQLCENIRAFAGGERGVAAQMLRQHLAEAGSTPTWIACVSDLESPASAPTWVSAESRNGLVLCAIGQSHANRLGLDCERVGPKAFDSWMRSQSVASPASLATTASPVDTGPALPSAPADCQPAPVELVLWESTALDGTEVTMLFASEAIMGQLARHVQRCAGKLGVVGDISRSIRHVSSRVSKVSDAAAVERAISDGRAYGFTARERAAVLAHSRVISAKASKQASAVDPSRQATKLPIVAGQRHWPSDVRCLVARSMHRSTSSLRMGRWPPHQDMAAGLTG